MIGEHSRLMARAGHRVRIIAGRGGTVDPGVEFVNLPLVDSQAMEVLAVKSDLDAGTVPPGFEELTARIEGQLIQALADADWLFAHNVCSLNKNLPLTAALRRISLSRTGLRLVLWHHDLAWTTPRYRDQLHSGLPWDLLRTDWPEASQVTVSQFRRAELTALLGVTQERVQVIPNGIDVSRFLKLTSATIELTENLDLLSAAPLILMPVRITPRKNVELALRTMARLKERSPQALLLVTGPSGPHNKENAAYLDALLALRRELGLEDRAVFLSATVKGGITDEVMGDLYQLADAMLVTSREEGFGIPVLEAGLGRVAAFCSDIEPLRELGAQEVRYFSPDADPNEVADLISGTLEGNRSYALRKRVLRDFAWSRIYSRYLAPLLAGVP